MKVINDILTIKNSKNILKNVKFDILSIFSYKYYVEKFRVTI